MLPGCKNEKATGLNDMEVVAEKVKVGDSEVISCDLTKLKDTVDLPAEPLCGRVTAGQA